MQTHLAKPESLQRNFASLDGITLYGMLVEFRPKRLIEVLPPGHSDHGLATHITSIDPEPRVEIDQICDRIIRKPLEEVDLSVFEELQPDDFLFIDGSHRTFTKT